MTVESISVCLAKGDPMNPLAELFERLGFPIDGYHSKNRTYRPEIEGIDARAKIMAEKDVALQIAAGNYDVGFCGEHWAAEHAVKYRASKLKVFKRLGLDKKGVYSCVSNESDFHSADDLKKKKDFVDVVSEYQNLAEHFAVKHRLRKFRIFPAWGSAEAYPPEHADVAILSARKESELAEKGLRVIGRELESEVCVVVNNESFEEKDLTPVLKYFLTDSGE